MIRDRTLARTGLPPFSERGGAAALVVLAAAAYLPVLHAGYIWDDNDYLTANPTLRTLDGLVQIWTQPRANLQYYPLYFTSYWIQMRLWGLHPLGYHLVNVGLHGIAAVLLWRVLARLRVPAGWLAGAVFAVHQVHVESVAWVTEQRNTLSTVWYLAAVWLYLRFAAARGAASSSGSAAAERAPAARLYLLALLAFAAALLTKTVTCTWPAAVLVLLIWRQGRLRPRDALRLLPFVLLAAALAAVTYAAERHGLSQRLAGTLAPLTPTERILLAGRAAWFYAGKLVWPAHLIHVYPRWSTAPSAGAWIYLLAWVALLAGLWAARRRLGGGPLAGVLIFLGTLAPVLGFVDFGYMQYSFVADRFAYLPSVALLPVLVSGVALLAARHVPDRRMRRAAAAVLLALLAFRTYGQARIYRDAATLWQDTLAKDPQSWVARLGLGGVLLEQGRAAEALACFAEARQLAPAPTGPRMALASAYAQLGRHADALAQYELLRHARPHDPAVYFNMGVLHVRRREFDAALAAYARALELDPDHAGARASLDLLVRERAEDLRAAQQPYAALDFLRRAVELAPQSSAARTLRDELERQLRKP